MRSKVPTGGFLFSFFNPENLEDKTDPKIKLYCVPIMYTDRDTTGIKPDHGITLTSCLMNPKSRGEVRIQSSNPLDLPLIDPNFLSHSDDIDVMLNAVKLARKVIQTKPLSDIVLEETVPGQSIDSDEDLINYSKKMIKTNWHPVGTCKMGNDSLSVVDPELKVHGIRNLSVVDASVMPTITSGNTNAPTMMIAERAAEFIRNTDK